MKDILEKYIVGTLELDSFVDNEKDIEYQKFIKKYPQYKLEELLKLQKDNLVSIIEEIDNIKKEFIYDSYIHGIRHNARVLFFSYIICYFENITGSDYKIIIDDAKYHDIGRVDDEIDPIHGLRSANMIDKVLDNYNDEDKRYLKGIMEIHSVSEIKNEDRICSKYNLNIDRFRRLYEVLKDADNLDRVRLDWYLKSDFTWLDPNYLRCDTSKKMITLAYEVNHYTRG